jgi:hypothetical protein
MVQHYLYRLCVYSVAVTHVVLIGTNLVAMPFIIWYTSWYIGIPLVTLLASPLLGGTNCIFNRLENYFRGKADMPLIYDRMDFIAERIKTWVA